MQRLTRSLCTTLAAVGLGILLVLATATMLDGLLRFIVSQPIDLVREIGDLVAAFAVACCLPMALENRSNITLRALDRLASPALLRAVDFMADLLVLAVLAAAAWQFFSFAQKTALAGDVTWMMNLPKAPFWFAVDAALWVSVLVQFSVVVRRLQGEQMISYGEDAL